MTQPMHTRRTAGAEPHHRPTMDYSPEGRSAEAAAPVLRPAAPLAVDVSGSEARAESRSATRAQPKAKGRFVALDLLRFLAVVLMVQGHTFREVLEQAVRAEQWHGYHNYVHGYTAPIFLFSSGLAFGITTFRSWDKHLVWGETLWKRFERYALLLLIGYAIHMPVFGLTAVSQLPDPALRQVLQVDALQNIGVMLGIAELMVLALRAQKRYVVGIAILGCSLVLAAPALWRLSLDHLPLFFAAYVSPSTGSMFPLAPWGAFLMFGILTGHALWDRENKAVKPRARWWLLAAGLTTILLGDRLAHAGIDWIWGDHNFWKNSPFFFLVRVGVVWTVLSLLMFASHHFSFREGSKMPKLIQTLGGETLVIYVAHLFVLYGSPINPGLARVFDENLDLGQSVLLFLGFFVAVTGLALGWHWMKVRYPLYFHPTRRVITLLAVVAFLLL